MNLSDGVTGTRTYRRRRRRLIRSIALCVAALFAIAYFGLWYATFSGHFEPPHMASAYAQYISEGNFELVSRRLTSDLRREFPNGTSSRELRDMLVSEGFRVFDGPVPDAPSNTRFARYAWGSGFVCTTLIMVSWSEDASRRIRNVAAGYEEPCI